MSSRSLTACGSPCIQPRRSPRASSASRSAASASSASPSRSETIAFSAGLTRSDALRVERISSTQDSSRRAIRSESAVASSIARTLAGSSPAGGRTKQVVRHAVPHHAARRRPPFLLGGRGALARGRDRRPRARAPPATRRCAPARSRSRACARCTAATCTARCAGRRGRPARRRGPARARRARRAQEPPRTSSRAPTPPRWPRPSWPSSSPTAPATCCCACSPAGWAASCSATWPSRAGRAPAGAARHDDRGRRAVGGGDVAQRPRPPADGAGRRRRGRGRAGAARRGGRLAAERNLSRWR